MPRVLQDESEERGRASWAAKLNERLQSRGMSRQRLASAAGVSRAQLDKYADGAVTPPGKHLAKFAELLDYDFFEQLEELGWLAKDDVRVARGRRVVRRQLRIHDELQRLVRLDADVNDIGPAAQIAQPLLQDGWTIRHFRDWLGERRRISFADIIELSPPDRLLPILADTTTIEPTGPLPAVARDATLGLTRAEHRLREIAVETIGADRFHTHECYWSSRAPGRSAFRGRTPAETAGLVLTVPWFLRRRYPGEDAAALTPRGQEGRSSGISSLAMIGLPYSGGPDIAAIIADEILGWGYAGVAMLTRERWHASDSGALRDSREQETARQLARGDDPRVQNTVWFYNEPAALIGSVDEFATATRRPAVIHLRFTDAALDDFLTPEWGGVPGRERADLLGWRDACDAAQRLYTQRHPAEDWLTVDVDLNSDHVGVDGADRREDRYLVDLAEQVELWLATRFGARRPEVHPDEHRLLALLAAPGNAAYTDTDIAAALDITGPAAKLLLSNTMLRHGLTSREELYSFARWRTGVSTGHG